MPHTSLEANKENPMHVAERFEMHVPPTLCIHCGIPLDSQYFDDSSVVDAPPPGKDVVLAQVELPPQYCGVLEYFSQFTDLHAKDPSQIETPGLEWRILLSNRPLYPYIKLGRIVNLWGYGGFPIAIRLDESSTVELVVRRVSSSDTVSGDVIKRVGGRIVGRYWYNAAYGDVVRRSF
jgi:hypothetical protein